MAISSEILPLTHHAPVALAASDCNQQQLGSTATAQQQCSLVDHLVLLCAAACTWSVCSSCQHQLANMLQHSFDMQVVVVLSGSMEPGFQRGDILFLNMGTHPARTGEIVVFNIDGRDIPIVHRVIKVHERANENHLDILTKVRWVSAAEVWRRRKCWQLQQATWQKEATTFVLTEGTSSSNVQTMF